MTKMSARIRGAEMALAMFEAYVSACSWRTLIDLEVMVGAATRAWDLPSEVIGLDRVHRGVAAEVKALELQRPKLIGDTLVAPSLRRWPDDVALYWRVDWPSDPSDALSDLTEIFPDIDITCEWRDTDYPTGSEGATVFSDGGRIGL